MKSRVSGGKFDHNFVDSYLIFLAFFYKLQLSSSLDIGLWVVLYWCRMPYSAKETRSTWHIQSRITWCLLSNVQCYLECMFQVRQFWKQRNGVWWKKAHVANNVGTRAIRYVPWLSCSHICQKRYIRRQISHSVTLYKAERLLGGYVLFNLLLICDVVCACNDDDNDDVILTISNGMWCFPAATMRLLPF